MNKVIVNNIPKDIQYSLDAEHKIHPQNVQFDIINPKDSIELAILCKELSIFNIQIDGGGNLSSMRRQSIDISFNEAIEALKQATSTHTSIKTYHKPFMKTHDYEKDSYFEYCTRFNWKLNDDYEDVFIWIRVEIKHLEEVLTKFKNKLEYYVF